MSWLSDSSTELALCIPHQESVSFDWSIRLSALQLPSHYISASSSPALDLARNNTIEKAIANSDSQWLLFLDTDVLPPKDVYYQLKRHELDIVSGIYFVQKEGIVHPAAWNLDETNTLSPIMQWPDNEVVNVDAVGLGCCLINTRVFEEISKPYVRWTEGFDDHPWQSKRTEVKGIGEDFYLFHKIKEETDYNVYLDTSIQCIHESKGALFNTEFMSMSDTQVNRQDKEGGVFE